MADNELHYSPLPEDKKGDAASALLPLGIRLMVRRADGELELVGRDTSQSETQFELEVLMEDPSLEADLNLLARIASTLKPESRGEPDPVRVCHGEIRESLTRYADVLSRMLHQIADDDMQTEPERLHRSALEDFPMFYSLQNIGQHTGMLHGYDVYNTEEGRKK